MIRQLLQKVFSNNKRMFKNLAFSTLVLIGLSMTQKVRAQYNSSHYTFGTGTDGSLETDFTGCDTAINASTASLASANFPIGFNFYFMGVAYTNFSMNNNGQVQLFTNNIGTAVTGGIVNCVAGSISLVPMSSTNRSKSVVYKTFGTAPNRKLIIQWNQFNINSTLSTASPAPGNVQVWIEEATGKVTYVYGEIYNAGTSTTRSVFISSGGTAGQSGCVTGINTATPALNATNTTSPTTTTIAAGSATSTTLIPNLGSSSNAARRYFSFTPPVGVSVSGLNFTNITVSGMKLNWTDNATNEAGYLIEYSTDNTNWTTAVITNTDATNTTISGLSSGTTYYWRVTTLTENGPTPNPATAVQATNTCGSLSGIISIGTTGTYSTISAAATEINTNGAAGSVTLELQPDYNAAAENFPINFTATPCLTGNNTITIRPAANVISPILITGSAAQDFLFDGTSNIVIDGRPGGVGTTSMLTIDNTSATGNCFTLQNGASNNIIQYCNITGANTSNSSGLVKFSTSNTTLGNSQNTIRYCNLTANATGTLAACIVSLGSTTPLNINNTIAYNNFSNFFNGANTSYGINIANSGNSKWNITGNSFYQTLPNPTSSATAGSVITAINVAIGDSTVIRSNFIGGNAPLAQGTWVSNAAITSNTQRIISIQNNGGSVALPTLIDSNVVTGFNFTNTNTTGVTGAGMFTAIYVAAGNANIGVNDGNLIGSMTTNDAIKVSAPFTAALSASTPSYCLNAISVNTISTSNVIVANNKIGGLTASGINANQNGRVTGIFNAAATMRILNNTIGGNVVNSLRCGNAGITSGLGEIYGIRDNAANPVIISSNTIQNISQMGNGSAVSPITGVYITGTNTTTTRDSIINNTIANIFNSSSDGAVGLKFESTYSFIYRNNIHDLVYANTSGNSAGIIGNNTSATATIAYNTIQRILHSSTDTTAGNIYGMNLNSASNANVYNNTIFMDNGAGSAITSGNVTVGIRMANSGNNIFNNLLIVNSNTTTSACLWNNAPNTTAAPTFTKLNANRNIYSINKKTRNFLFVQGDITSLNLLAFYNCDTCASLAGVVSPYSVTYDPNFNNNCSAYKNYIRLSGGRESATFNEAVNLVGGNGYPANLQPNPGGTSYAQNSGIIQGFSTDILGNTINNTTPDIGAIEFATGSVVEGAGSPLANNSGVPNTASGDATTTVTLYNAECELIAQVSPIGASPVAGTVNAQAWIDNNTTGNYAKRHIQITPINNVSTATASVTLYYTQQEFNEFNATYPSALPMPASSTDLANAANLRIQKLSGISSNGTGSPSSYPSNVPTTIVPDSVKWNADSLYWSVSFPVTGFSGFFLNTDIGSTPLPLNIINFKAIATSSSNQLTWTMAKADEKGVFEVMHSFDGARFESIGNLATNDNGNYTFNHETPEAMEIYQIKFTDAFGKSYYSNTQMIQRKDKANLAVMLYPNPTSQNTYLKVNIMNATNGTATYLITDMLGKEVLKGTIETMNNTNLTASVNIASLANGIYNFKLIAGNDQIVRKIVIAGK